MFVPPPSLFIAYKAGIVIFAPPTIIYFIRNEDMLFDNMPGRSYFTYGRM
jgi:hypothetical protein